MAIISLFEVQLKPEAVDAAVPILHRVLSQTRDRDGCHGVTVIQDTMDPTRFIAIERWESLDHDTAYREWRAGEGAVHDLAPLLAGPPKLTIADERDEV